MSQFEKAKKRIENVPKDYTYDELRGFLEHLGFEKSNRGKTSGSAVTFYRRSDGMIIQIHKPHPGNIVKQCYIKQILQRLKEKGDLNHEQE